MKKTLFIFGLIIVAVVGIIGIISCDIIPEEERKIKTDRLPITKNVLVSYFTDQTCVNCPASSEFLEESLKKTFGDTLVVVSIHAYQNPPPALILVTEKGNEYKTHFNVVSHPSASIDGGDPMTREGWADAIISRLISEAKIGRAHV